MRKVLSITLALLIVFTLSGCGENEWKDMSDLQKDTYCSKTTNMVEARCTIWNNIVEPTYYTQEEVDELIEESARYQENRYLEYFVFYEESNGLLYAQCHEASGYEECFVELNYQIQIDELLQRIEQLEANTLFASITQHDFNDTQFIKVIYETHGDNILVTEFSGCIEVCEGRTVDLEVTREEFYTWWTTKIEEYENYIGGE